MLWILNSVTGFLNYSPVHAGFLLNSSTIFFGRYISIFMVYFSHLNFASGFFVVRKLDFLWNAWYFFNALCQMQPNKGVFFGDTSNAWEYD